MNETTGESLLERDLEFQGNTYRPGQGEVSVKLSTTIDDCLVGRVSWVSKYGDATLVVALRATKEGIVDLAGSPIPADRWIGDYACVAGVNELKSLEQDPRTDLLTEKMLTTLNEAAVSLQHRLKRK